MIRNQRSDILSIEAVDEMASVSESLKAMAAPNEPMQRGWHEAASAPPKCCIIKVFTPSERERHEVSDQETSVGNEIWITVRLIRS